MKLSMFPIVEQAIAMRAKVLRQIADVEMGMAQVVVRGETQDEAMHLACRSAIVCELKGRLASLERDLEAYGITVDTEQG